MTNDPGEEPRVASVHDADPRLLCRRAGHDYGDTRYQLVSTCVRCGVVRDSTGRRRTYTFPAGYVQPAPPTPKEQHMARVKITGYLDVEDHEADPGDDTGLTNEAYERFAMNTEGTSPQISVLDDLTIEKVDD